jgi:peptidoglycan L-alanyl-D-glutamate endopeptidase CwlK
MSLNKKFREKVYRLLGDLAEERIYMVIVETSRTIERQRELVDAGLSRTMDSKHIRDLAVDMYPVQGYTNEGRPRVSRIIYDPKHPVWQKVGAVAERHEIFWGGRWENFKDYGHFEEPE